MKPMLADDAVIENLKYPLFASPKLDGIRALVVDGKLLARSMKHIPNLHIFNAISNPAYNGLDGELIFGPPNATDVCRATVSAVMGHGGTPHVTYYVFDKHDVMQPYHVRREVAKAMVASLAPVGLAIKMHSQREVHDYGQLRAFEDECLEKGFEGLIVRDPDSFYKNGRSTAREGIMLKIKRFTDAEAEIVGWEEEMKNNNEATTNELGRTKRSTAKEGLTGKGVLGAWKCRDLASGALFNCGTGMKADERVKYWKEKEAIQKKYFVKYKSFKIGEKDAPRHPVFLSLRPKIDTSK
jgi:DNA ligase-1